jgi:hypothetical protein
MAVTDAYATAALYRAVLTKTDTAEDAEILDDLTAVSRYLDHKLRRFFTKDAAAVARVYLPKSGPPTRADWAETENPWKYGGLSRTLFVDDLVSVTTIKIDEDGDGLFTDETALDATDYELTPRNAALGSEVSPYTGIELTDYGAKTAFPRGQRVQVTGVWGWPAIPKAIERATIHLTGILRIESARATRRVSEDITSVMQTSRECQDIVNDLNRHYGKIVV